MTGNADSEILPGDFFQFVRLVEHHGVVFGDNSSALAFFYGQIGEKEMMIDDDQIALRRAPMHESDKAAVELLAFLARAHIGARIEFPPGRALFRKSFDLGAI